MIDRMKPLLFIIALCMTTLADAADIKLPFGIRHYETGEAHDFTLQDIDGEEFRLNDTRGQWVFLHFWASWCGPCRKEMPTLQQLAESFPEDELKIVMVNTAEDEDTIFTFLAAINVELNSLMDADGLVTEVWKPRGLPTTFLIDPKGEVKYQAVGGREWGKPSYINFIRQLVTDKD
ncbi:MAG TPA: TlpA family protein disulfide reductase [Gammaproteobacteria bacterium]|nr:TlpA family protein disulfide reductase [Gammaproteobacteria bacterium]